MEYHLSKFFFVGIFLLAITGLLISSFGQTEQITGHQIIERGSVSSEIPEGMGFFGFLLAFVTLLSLLAIGFYAYEHHREEEENKPNTIGAEDIDAEIEAIHKRLEKL